MQSRRKIPRGLMLKAVRQYWIHNKPWIWRDVVIPLLITRSALLLVGWLSRYLPPYPKYPNKEALKQGWQFSSHRLLDIWGRWDTRWYESIVLNG